MSGGFVGAHEHVLGMPIKYGRYIIDACLPTLHSPPSHCTLPPHCTLSLNHL